MHFRENTKKVFPFDSYARILSRVVVGKYPLPQHSDNTLRRRRPTLRRDGAFPGKPTYNRIVFVTMVAFGGRGGDKKATSFILGFLPFRRFFFFFSSLR